MRRFPIALSLWRSVFLAMRFISAWMDSTMTWNSRTSCFECVRVWWILHGIWGSDVCVLRRVRERKGTEREDSGIERGRFPSTAFVEGLYVETTTDESRIEHRDVEYALNMNSSQSATRRVDRSCTSGSRTRSWNSSSIVTRGSPMC